MTSATKLHDNSSFSGETETDRQWRIMTAHTMSLDLVSALAGDRLLTKAERHLLNDLRKQRSSEFFSDLLYSITHQPFLPELAEQLWSEILQHKHGLSTILGRNVKISVAALDYLSNITTNLSFPMLIGEVHFKEIIGRSLRDGLTGLFNHTYFYQQLDLEMRRYRRYGTVVSLALIDIDDFKMVNDCFGHREGDRILAAMGETLICIARTTDICCRYGGEELAVILPSTEVHEAGAIANRLKIELTEYLPDDRAVTVSIGVASSAKTIGTYQELVETADTALYEVKHSGKNRVLAVTDR